MSEYDNLKVLFNKLAQYNPRYTFEDGSVLLNGCVKLLNNYPDACLLYINDTTNTISLLSEIAGSDALKQLMTHKDFRFNYGISIY